jgi:hypothetical protein
MRQKASINGVKSPEGKRPHAKKLAYTNMLKYTIADQPVRALKIKKNNYLLSLSGYNFFFL